MKAGRSLSELAAELERQVHSKKDFIASTSLLSAQPVDNGIVLNGVNGGMKLRATAHQQLAATLGIPKVYYDRMLNEKPDLLATNVNTWLVTEPSRKLIRTLDNEVRAILSDSYRPLDNIDLAEAVLPKLISLDAQVVSAEVTDSRFYIKAVTPKIQGVVNKIGLPTRHHIGEVDDVIQAGLVVSNSEVGLGALRLEEMDYRLVCYNGLIREVAVRKAHLGRGAKGDAIEDAREFFRTETRIADDRAFFMKVGDAVGAMFNKERFERRIAQYSEATALPIPEPVKCIELTSKRFGFNETERGSVLKHLIEGGDLSAWGLANAVTRAAHDVPSYDRATELESIGGDIIELSQHDWKALAV